MDVMTQTSTRARRPRFWSLALPAVWIEFVIREWTKIGSVSVHGVAARAMSLLQMLPGFVSGHPGWVALSLVGILAVLAASVISLARTDRRQAVVIQRLMEKDAILDGRDRASRVAPGADRRSEDEEYPHGGEIDLRLIFANLPLTVFAADRSGRIKRLGGKEARTLGLEPEDCEGRLIPELSHSAALFCRHYQSALEGKSSSCVEQRNGQLFSVHHSPMRDENGEVRGLVGLAIRLTGHGAMVGTDGSPGDGASLAAGLRNHLLAPWAEELRKPLNSIFAVADLLRQANTEPEVQECLDVLMYSSQSALRALKDAEDLAQLDAGKLEVELAEFSLRKVLAETLEPFAADGAHGGRRVNWNVDPEARDRYIGDSHRLRQTLCRLVSYDMDFGSIEGLLVEVQSDCDDKQISTLSFTISRAGCAEVATSQSSASVSLARKRAMGRGPEIGDGGLGLAQGLIEMMGGRLVIQQNEAAGILLRFAVKLKSAGTGTCAPANEPERPMPRRRLTRSENAAKTASARKPILVAGFRDQAQANVTASLQDRGHAVVAVEDESEMLALLEKYNWGGFQLLVVRHEGALAKAEEMVEFIGQQASQAGNDLPIMLVSPTGVKYGHLAGVEEPIVPAGPDDPMNELQITEAIETLCGKFV